MSKSSVSTHKTIWPKPIRILHWIVALGVVLNFLNDGDDGVRLLHQIVGYSVAGAVVIRIIIGFFNKSNEYHYARFSNWHLSPRHVAAFVRTELAAKAYPFEGHNPAASWVYIGIWSLVIALGVTGYMMGSDAYFGEEWVEDLHGALTNVLLALIAAHFAGMAKEFIKTKKKVWLRMIQG